jgi:hypothetical protein
VAGEAGVAAADYCCPSDFIRPGIEITRRSKCGKSIELPNMSTILVDLVDISITQFAGGKKK